MPKILERLVRQLRARGNKNPYALATAILEHHGILKPGTRQLTAKGKIRNAMTPAQRAKSRAAKYAKSRPSKYKYSKRTNRATKKRK